MGLTSRRRPYPWLAEIPAGNGVMLVPSQTGELIGHKAEQFERVNPVEYNFDSLPPFVETYFPFTRLIRGAGEKTQSSKASKSYYYAIDADCSIGGYPSKGTLFRAQTPLATGEIRDGVAAFDGGVLTEFAAAGRYVLKRTGDGVTDWAVSKDFGVGRQVQQMARFKNAGVSVVDALYVGLDNGEWWRYNGAAWTQGPTAEADASAAYGYFLEVTDDRLYRATGASGNVVRSCSNDPFTASNWSGPITVGEASSPITWLRTIHKTLVAFKTIGPFSLNADGTDNELFPELRAQPAATNGRGAAAWRDALWFRHGDSYYRMDVDDTGGAALTPIGPERLIGNDAETRGRTVCGAGFGTAFYYFGVYNPSNGNSYLWKLGTWLNPGETNSGKWEFVEAYHGAVKKWTGKQITAMRVSNTASGNDRLFAYFADGTVEWTKLPQGTPNHWAVGSGCEFTDQSAYVYAPEHHAMAQADNKAYRGWSVFGPVVDANNYATVGYRIPPATAWTEVGPFVTHGQRIDPVSAVAGKALQSYLKLDSASTASTPVLEGITVHHAIRPNLLLHYAATVDAQNARARRDGVVDKKTAERIRTAVKAAAATVGSVTVVLPDEQTRAVSVVNYVERELNLLNRYGLGWHLDVEFVEFRTYSVYGIWGRLRPYLWGDLRGMTWGQLRSL